MRKANVSLFGGAAIAAMLAVLAGCGAPTTPQQTETKPEMTYAASLKTIETSTVATIGQTGPVTMIPEVMGKLMTWAQAAKVPVTGAPFGVYMSPPETPADSWVWEICLPVPAETRADEKSGVTIKPFGGMEVACAVYAGPYDGVGTAYDSLAMWVDAQGYTIAGPAIETYITNPQTTPAESLKTEIAFPVMKAPEPPAEQ